MSKERLIEKLEVVYDELSENTQEVIENALEVLKIINLTHGGTAGYIITVATGGPHIEINTRDGLIQGWWGADYADISIPWHLVEEIENALSEVIA
ncbi:MAG TPA: hypothetical protein ENF81_05905 [Thermotogaceae bacterium]|nr:hypothetical protein [Thermotogaceae bacterium]